MTWHKIKNRFSESDSLEWDEINFDIQSKYKCVNSSVFFGDERWTKNIEMTPFCRRVQTSGTYQFDLFRKGFSVLRPTDFTSTSTLLQHKPYFDFTSTCTFRPIRSPDLTNGRSTEVEVTESK